MVQATPDKLRSSYSVMTYHKEGPACGKIPCDPTSSEARPCQQSCRDGLRISTLNVCCESLDFVGFLRWRRTIYTLFIPLDDRIGISKRVNTYTHLGLEDAEDELRRLEDLQNARKELERTQGEKPVSQKMFKAI